MKIRHAIIPGLILIIALTFAGCGNREEKRIAGFKENIGLEYHADLNLAKGDDGKFTFGITEIFDIAKRPSEGNRIIGVRIGNKKINYQVIGAEEYTYFEEPDGIRLMLGEPQEFILQQAGRFRIRLTRDYPVNGAASGIFRKKLTFDPAQVWALVEDESKTEGYTPVRLDEPDLGYVLLHTNGALGTQQPAGGRRAADRRSLNYTIPADLAQLKPLIFTYFPSRTSYFAGSITTWILNRLAWMVFGILLYIWWVRSKARRKKEKSAIHMVKKKNKIEPEGNPKT